VEFAPYSPSRFSQLQVTAYRITGVGFGAGPGRARPSARLLDGLLLVRACGCQNNLHAFGCEASCSVQTFPDFNVSRPYLLLSHRRSRFSGALPNGSASAHLLLFGQSVGAFISWLVICANASDGLLAASKHLRQKLRLLQRVPPIRIVVGPLRHHLSTFETGDFNARLRTVNEALGNYVLAVKPS
jgi:hypothetical protein